MTAAGDSPAREATAAPAPSDIAIVGAACRFPGAAKDVAAFWELLDRGECAVGEVPAGRWPIDDLYDPDPSVPGRLYTRHGGFLPAIESFDAAFFGIAPAEAAMLDPQQRLLLEVGWETLEDAAVPPERLHALDPGVFVGLRASEYFQSQCARLPEDADAFQPSGNSLAAAAGRLSRFLGFRGPSLAIDADGASALVALHHAVRSLRDGTCRAALAGGVNALVDPLTSVGLCRARRLSQDGRCRVFDARADGYARAEGCGLVLLMRRDDAERLGLPVRAVVRGSAVGHDAGNGAELTAIATQQAVVSQALADAGLRPAAIDYVEVDGASTAAGDAIEVQALDAVFAGRRAGGLPVLVGSAKTNLGHLEAAAGIASLLKVVLALQHERLPRHLHLEQPNAHVDWVRSEVVVTEEARAWPRGDRVRCAGISAFGHAGAIAHVVLAEGDAKAPLMPSRRYQPVVLSAPTEAALRQQAANWADAVTAADAPPLADVALTAGHGRRHFAHRLGIVASDAADLANGLRSYADGVPTGVAIGHVGRRPPRLALLFPGQGAQRPGAGRELYREEPLFRAAIDRLSHLFLRLRDVELTQVLFGDDSERLRRTDYTQPALFALQWALAEMWRGFGAEPALVLGHGVGELTAAAVAGVFTPEDGLRLCAARGALTVQHCAPGAMLTVAAASDRLEPLLRALPGPCAIAAVNGPAETVVSGEAEVLDVLARRLGAREVRSQRLPVSHAFHSPRMTPMLAPFARLLARTPMRAPRLPLVSCRRESSAVTPDLPEHWLRHVVEPVHFATALATTAGAADVLVEISAAPVLLPLAARALPRPVAAVASLRPGAPERAHVLRGVVQLHVLGAAIDFAAVTAADSPRRAALPSHPFERQRAWLRHRAALPRSAVHPLLGAPLPTLVLQSQQRLFEGALAERSPAWLADHRIYDRALLPAACFVECALAAGAQAFGTSTLELRDVAILAPLWLDPQPTTTQVLLDGGEDGAHFRICRRDGQSWPVHATGTVALLAAHAQVPVVPDAAAATTALPVEQLYDDYVAAGLDYGPAFRAVRGARRGAGAAQGHVALPAELLAEAGPYVVHPVLLDACFQIAGLAMAERIGDATWLAVGIERLCVLRAPGTDGTCRARLRPGAGERTRVLDLWLLDQTGRVAVAVQGLQLQAAESHVLAAVDSSRWLHGVHWQRRPRPEPPDAPGDWIVTSPELHEGARALATQLAAAGARARALPLDAALLALQSGVQGIAFDASAPLPDIAASLAATLAELAQVVRAAAATTPPVRLAVLTSDAVAADVLDRVTSAHGAMLWGCLRTVALEHPELRALCVDRDERTGLDLVARELLLCDDEDMVALRSDQRFAARMFPGTMRPGDVALPAARPWRLRGQEGRFDRLLAEPQDAAVPGPGEVAIEVAAVGLGRHDVQALAAARPEAALLGGECSGTIAALGDGVSGLRVGDPVMAWGHDLLRSHAVVPATQLAAVPPGVELPVAAGLPAAFATAMHALLDLAQVRAGERVLLHAAGGGFGFAALQVLERQGAVALATSSPAKAALLREHGVLHWADSHADFADDLRLAAPDGVDVVVHSLPDDTVVQSLELLRPGGRFVDLGGDSEASRRALAARPDVRRIAVDLRAAAAADPGLLPRLLQQLQRGLVEGTLRPLRTTFVPVARAAEAFAALVRNRHAGKVVLTLPRALAIRADRTYVISGGTGAVGRAVARALVDHGARHLALIARSAVPQATLRDFAAPATVRLFAADVARPGPLTLAVRELKKTMPPVAGVVHAAGALHDVLVRDLELSTGLEVLRAKVDGARHLAALLDDGTLDFFVATSSMASWLGNQGQAAYGAANAWLDAFCLQRSARGRRSLSLAFGPWAESGMAARLSARARGRLRDLGIDSIPPTVGAALFVQTVLQHERCLGALPVRWQLFVRQFPLAVPPLLRGLVAAQPAAADTDGRGAGGLLPVLQALRPRERAAALTEHLCGEVARALVQPPDAIAADVPLASLGLDSLNAVEIRTRLGRALQLPLPATLLFQHLDLAHLARHLLALLADEAGPAADPVEVGEPEAPQPIEPPTALREPSAEERG